MTDAEGSAWACPYLSLPKDTQTHFSFPVAAHRCHATDKAQAIDLSYQAMFCLGAEYDECAIFKSATRPIPVWHPAASRSQSAVNAPKSKSRASPAWLQVVYLLAVVGVLALTMIALGGLFLLASQGSDASDAAATSTPPSIALITPSPLLPPTPTTTHLASPRTTPAQTPTFPPLPSEAPAPTATPRPNPSPIAYVVARGDTLTSIAVQFGVSVEDLAALNGLEDRNEILIGQVLLIPVGP